MKKRIIKRYYPSYEDFVEAKSKEKEVKNKKSLKRKIAEGALNAGVIATAAAPVLISAYHQGKINKYNQAVDDYNSGYKKPRPVNMKDGYKKGKTVKVKSVRMVTNNKGQSLLNGN